MLVTVKFILLKAEVAIHIVGDNNVVTIFVEEQVAEMLPYRTFITRLQLDT